MSSLARWALGAVIFVQIAHGTETPREGPVLMRRMFSGLDSKDAESSRDPESPPVRFRSRQRATHVNSLGSLFAKTGSGQSDSAHDLYSQQPSSSIAPMSTIPGLSGEVRMRSGLSRGDKTNKEGLSTDQNTRLHQLDPPMFSRASSEQDYNIQAHTQSSQESIRPLTLDGYQSNGESKRESPQQGQSLHSHSHESQRLFPDLSLSKSESIPQSEHSGLKQQHSKHSSIQNMLSYLPMQKSNSIAEGERAHDETLLRQPRLLRTNSKYAADGTKIADMEEMAKASSITEASLGHHGESRQQQVSGSTKPKNLRFGSNVDNHHIVDDKASSKPPSGGKKQDKKKKSGTNLRLRRADPEKTEQDFYERQAETSAKWRAKHAERLAEPDSQPPRRSEGALPLGRSSSDVELPPSRSPQHSI